MDALSIATFAADQLTIGFRDVILTMNVDYMVFEGSPIVELSNLHNIREIEEENAVTTTTAQILAEMRANNRAAIQTFTESVDETVATAGKQMRRNGVIKAGGPRYGLTYSSFRADAATTAHVLLKGTEDVIGFSNNVRREFSLPRRALSMASSRGRCTPDMLDSLMAFFGNPSSMASHLLASFLPERPSYPALVTYLADNGIEASTAEIKALKLFGGNRAVGGAKGGRPRKVRTAESFGQGHKRPYVSAAAVDGPIPGGNDTMHGAGHDQGAGWSEAWATQKPLTPAQTSRRDAALQMSSHGYRTDAEGAVIERW